MSDARDPEAGGSVFLPDEPPRSRAGWGRYLFGLQEEVTPGAYASIGFGLMAFKYAVEAGSIHAFTRRFFSPLDFLNPLLSMRQEFFQPPAPEWLQWVIFCWSLPFLWIAVSMSVRRSANAGLTAWVGLLVLCPFVNYLVMLALCCAPSWHPERRRNRPVEPVGDHQVKSALLGNAVKHFFGTKLGGLSKSPTRFC